jgi:hypothetical protein
MEFWIWIVIILVVALAKGLGKLQSESGEDTNPRPPVVRPPQRRTPPSGRSIQPRTRPQVPRPVPPPMPGAWMAKPEAIRQFVEHLEHRMEPRPVAPTTMPAAKRPTRPPRPTPKPPKSPEPVSTEKPPRATQWAAALRDRQNLRNIVIAAEIIGPPRGA